MGADLWSDRDGSDSYYYFRTFTLPKKVVCMYSICGLVHSIGAIHQYESSYSKRRDGAMQTNCFRLYIGLGGTNSNGEDCICNVSQ